MRSVADGACRPARLRSMGSRVGHEAATGAVRTSGRRPCAGRGGCAHGALHRRGAHAAQVASLQRVVARCTALRCAVLVATCDVAMQCRTMLQHVVLRCIAQRCVASPCAALHRAALRAAFQVLRCVASWCVALRCSVEVIEVTLRFPLTDAQILEQVAPNGRCNTARHVATRCDTLQRVATHAAAR